MKVKSFTVFEEYYELITLLDEEEQKNLLLAIFKFMFEDIEPTLDSRENKVFNNLKRPLIISKNKSNSKQNKIKIKSNENQNEIKIKSNEDETTSVVTKSMSMSNKSMSNNKYIKYSKYNREQKPEWFDKDLKNEKLTEEENEELNNLLESTLKKIETIGDSDGV